MLRQNASKCRTACTPFLQATSLMGCAQKLTSQISIDQDVTSAWAVHYRVGMAKALVDDLAHAAGISRGLDLFYGASARR
ncbi:DUF3077 domain-containing protein [Pseudomonas donghuensis]|uniref:DUF3077 domain-containing protein n=1 Tax=Pseudomonas donghuensis TaxID=1163398 RepID=UPI00398E4B96